MSRLLGTFAAVAVTLTATITLTTTTVGSAAAQEPVPRAVSLIGSDLHLPHGRVVHLPAAAGGQAVLLGTVRDGWVVASGDSFRLVRPDGRVRTIAARDRTNPEVTESLSADGRWITSSAVDQADAVTLTVVDLQGREVLGGWYQNLGGDVLAATRGRVYVGGWGGLRFLDRSTSRPTRVLDEPAYLVDPAHETVFVDGPAAGVGPTDLDAPGAPRWHARFEPAAVSPDGRHVVGREGTVRSMTNGRVVRRVPVPQVGDGGFRFLGWASSRRVLLERPDGRRRTALVSCPVPRGSCRPVGSTLGAVSVPTSHAGPYHQP